MFHSSWSRATSGAYSSVRASRSPGSSSQDHDSLPQLEVALGATGGRFFDVQRKEQLQEAYDTIDALERQQLVTEQYVRDTPYYQPFVGLALFLFVGACVLRAFPRFTEIC